MSLITYDITKPFPFEQLSLENPHGVQGGAYFSKIRINGNPFLFQTPKCTTKSGIVTTEKKVYCDLILTSENDQFIQFLQELEKAVQTLIYEKRNIWFHNDMEMENIEYFFNPLIRTYKKKFLVRTYIQQPKHIKSTESLQIYDEMENALTIEDVKKEKKVVALLEGLGIKFTSSSFHLELCLRQAMILEDKPIFHKCLIQMKRPDSIAEKEKNDIILAEPKEPEKPKEPEEPEESEESEGHIETDNEENQDEQQETVKDTSDNIIQPQAIIKAEHLEQNKELCEIKVNVSEEGEDSIKLKAPIVVYREIYKKAKEKAKIARRLAIQAFLEAKKIKNTFLVGEIEDSDDDDLDTFAEFTKE